MLMLIIMSAQHLTPERPPLTDPKPPEMGLSPDQLRVRDTIDQLAIADEAGVVPTAVTKAEQFWRPERASYAIKPKGEAVISAREEALTGYDHQPALEAVGQLLGALSTKAFLVGTGPTRLNKTKSDSEAEALMQKIKTVGPANYRTAVRALIESAGILGGMFLSAGILGGMFLIVF